MSGSSRPTVAILMCTASGAAFIEPQLRSIADQSHSRWRLYVSDDGSRDATFDKLHAFRDQRHRDQVEFRGGPGRGPAANFLSLACDTSISADYYAFSDQDDVWERDKLARAVFWLQKQPPALPALYCSATRLISASGRVLGLSQLFRRPPSFPNALVQNLAGGNTMVFNGPARALLMAAGKDVGVPCHDWWLYQLVSGAGGRVRYDQYPTVRYRQHGANHTGETSSWPARARWVGEMLLGRHRRSADATVRALTPHVGLLTPENRRVFEQFVAARNGRLLARFNGLRLAGIHRQTTLGNLALALAAALNKV